MITDGEPGRVAQIVEVPARFRGQIPGLTGLRGLGAAWVVLFHLTQEQDIAILDKGFLGVDLFFILSGFVLSHVYPADIRTLRNYAEFLKLRFARIYPLYVFVLCAVGLVVVLLPGFADNYPFPQRRFGPEAFIASLVLIQNWAYFLPGCWNAPAWSLSAEWFAYLAFPAFQYTTLRFRSRHAPLLVMMTGFLLLYMILSGRGASLNVSGSPGMLRMVVEFAAGCLLCRAWKNGLTCPPTAATTVALGLLMLGLLIPGAEILALPAFSLFVLLAVQRDGLLPRIAQSPAILWLGDISYSLYLDHWLIIQLANWWNRDIDMPLAAILEWMVALMAAMLLVAAMTHRWIELPARAWVRQMGTRPRRRPAPGFPRKPGV